MDLLTILLTTGVTGALITAVSVVVQVILNKKLRTPADRNSEVTTLLQFFREGITDSREDRNAMEATTKDLRLYIATLEKQSRESFALITTLETRIADLERRILEKDARILTLERALATFEDNVPPLDNTD